MSYAIGAAESLGDSLTFADHQVSAFRRELDAATRATRTLKESLARSSAAARVVPEVKGKAAKVDPKNVIDADAFRGASVDIAAHLGAALKSSNPARGMTAGMNQEFDRVGGTIVTSMRRIDAAIKFPVLNKAVKDTGDSLERFGTRGVELILPVKKALDGTVPILKEIADAAGQAGAAQSRMKAPAEAIGRAWESVRARVAAARAEIELAATRPPPAGARPGVGRAVALPKPQVSGVDKALVGAFNAADAAGKRLGPTLREVAQFSRETWREQLQIANVTAGATVRGLALATSGLVEMGRGVLRAHNYLGSMGDVAGKTFSEIYKDGNLLKAAFLRPGQAVTALANKVVHLGTLGVFKKKAKEAQLLRGSLIQASRGAQQLGNSIAGVGRNLLMAFGVVGVTFKLAQWLKGGVKGAIDLGETLNVTRETFGKFAGAVEGKADQLSKEFGFNKGELLDSANAFGALAQGAKMTEAESAKLSSTFVQLAADAVSYKNKGLDVSFGKIQAALRGQSEPLSEFGVLINENMVKAEALRQGLARGKGELSEYAKMTARAALIQQGLAKASGDLGRTSDSAANQFRKAGGGVENFGIRIGQVLLPAVQVGIVTFNEFLATVIEVFETNLPVIESWGESLKTVMEGVGVFLRNFGTYLEIAKLKVGEWGSNVVNWLETIPANFAILTEYVGKNWHTLWIDAFTYFETFATNLVTNAVNLGTAIWDALTGKEFKFEFTPFLKGFQALSEKLPEFIKPGVVSVQDQIDKLQADVIEKELKRKASIAKPAEKAKPAAAAAAAEGERKFAQAAELGSKEAYSAVLKFQGTAKGDDPTKKIAKNSDQQVKHLKDIADAVKKPKGGGVPTFSFGGA